jgi:sugar/nucleoside kinase (ribokinase family)
VRPVAVIGNLACDIVDGGPPRVGGGSFHSARAFRQLGAPALVVTKSTEADAADLLPPLRALGVPVHWRPASHTARFAFHYEGDDRVMRMDEVGEPWAADDLRGWVAEALDDAEWVQVAPLARGEFGPDAIRELARGRRLLLDAQGLVREAHTGPLVLAGEPDPDVLRHLTVLKLAYEEAEALLGGYDEATLLGLGVPEVLVTFGSHGCSLLADGELTEVRARAVDRDPTGAGDAFGAGYVAARNAGAAPRDAARRAADLVSELLELGA